MSISPSAPLFRRTLAATALTIAVGALAFAQDPANPFNTDEAPPPSQASPFEGAAPAPEGAPATNPFSTGAPSPAAPAPAPAIGEDALPFDTSDRYASSPAQPGAPAAAATPAPAAAPAAPPVAAAPAAPIDNPFGSAPDPFEAADDPFGSTTLGTAPVAGSAPAPAGAADNPFATDGAPAAPPMGNPFGATGTGVASPAAPGAPMDNPFSSGETDEDARNPFGAGVAAPADDPFGGTADDPFGAPADPFGGAPTVALPTQPAAAASTAAATTADPFEGGPAVDDPFGAASPVALGGTPEAAPADPFGGGAVAAPADDPFGGAAPVALGGTPAAPADPFGGGTAAPADPFGGGGVASAVPADPFGGAAPAAPTDPFGGGTAAPAAGTDPFGGAGNQPVVPLFDAAGGIASALGGETGAGAPATDNPDGISQLYSWRYERTRLWDGTPIVARRRLTVEEAQQYDERVKKIYTDAAAAGTLPGFTGGSDPATWAEWAIFADQLQLWSEYVDNVVLAGFNEGPGAFEQIQWPGQPQEGGQPAGGEAGGVAASGGGAERLVAQTQNQSLDDQAGGFFEFNLGGGGQNAGIPASTITDQVVTAYDAVLTRLREIEAEQEDFMTAFEARLIERNTRRIAYADWKADREQVLDDFIKEWNRRYSGKVSVINGVRYELYRPGEAPEVFPRNTTPVVTDYDLTPYDIVNPEDGTLKAARRD